MALCISYIVHVYSQCTHVCLYAYIFVVVFTLVAGPLPGSDLPVYSWLFLAVTVCTPKPYEIISFYSTDVTYPSWVHDSLP